MIERIGSHPPDLYTTTRLGDKVNSIENTQDNTVIQEQAYDTMQNKEKVLEVIERINGFMEPSHTSLKFEFHEKLNDYYVQVIDDNTKEVVREIPSKKVLDMYAAMKEYMGLMIDEKR